MEAKRFSCIYFFNPPYELFPALFFMRPEAHYISSLHDQIQITATFPAEREETVEFP